MRSASILKSYLTPLIQWKRYDDQRQKLMKLYLQQIAALPDLASDVYEITSNQLAHYQDIHAFDVIPFNNLLLTIGENGFYQYNYSDLQNIELLSTIPVVK